jgi:hypothetical protein
MHQIWIITVQAPVISATSSSHKVVVYLLNIAKTTNQLTRLDTKFERKTVEE